MRLDRLENQIRQLTGTVEQLQFRNQQLEQQLRRGQEDTEYRSRSSAARADVPPSARRSSRQPVAAAAAFSRRLLRPGRRSDVFDPTRSGALARRGARRLAPGRPLGARRFAAADHERGAAGRRARRPRRPARPLDAVGQRRQRSGRRSRASTAAVIAAAPAGEPRMIPGALPPPPPRNPNATGAQPQIAMAPSQTPSDEFALALRLRPAQGLRAGRGRLSRIPEEISERPAGRRRAITGWAKACSSASATVTPRSPSSTSRPSTRRAERRRTRCCASASRSPRSARRRRPAPRSARSAANIPGIRRREAERRAGTEACEAAERAEPVSDAEAAAAFC